MQTSNIHRIQTKGIIAATILVALTAASIMSWIGIGSVFAQETGYERFREGEKLTYNISFEKFSDAAYAEVYVASKGTIEGKEASEIRGRIKSRSLVSAAFYLFDRSRSVFASEETGLPMYIKDTSFVSGLPVESITSFLSEPATSLDFLTLFYKTRENGGAGSFSVVEEGRQYSFDFAPTGGETVETAGEVYETNVSSVTSSYFQENDISAVTVNFSTGADRVPVKIGFSTPKGRFEALLASVSVLTAPTPDETPTQTVTPTVPPTPTPTVTPTPYVENVSLSPDLPFKLGEKLAYRVTRGGSQVSNLEFVVDSRKEVAGTDSLLIKASVSEEKDGSLFARSDKAEIWVDPYTLVPNRSSLSLDGPLSNWSQQEVFDQEKGIVIFGNASSIEVPIGTHSLLSFAYAVRSFNLRPSKDPKNPVNDTRVAVFVNNRAYILTLRPASNESIEIGGRKTSAQLITVITGDPAVDRLRPRVWLSTDSSRVPLRFVIGEYQADLIQ